MEGEDQVALGMHYRGEASGERVSPKPSASTTQGASIVRFRQQDVR